MAAAASDNPSAATSHPSSTTQDPSSTTDHRSIEISYDDGRQSRRLSGGVDESTTDGIMMKGVTIKEMDDIERTSSPSNDSNGADSDDEKDGGAEGHGEHVNLARQVTDTGEIVPNSYLDYIAKLRNVWKDAPDVIVDMKDLNYTIPLPNTSKIPSILNSFIDMYKPLENLIQGKTLDDTYDLPALHNVTTSIKPSTMTLVLAPPGHGKSTLLKAISGQLHLHRQHSKLLSGQIKWNGRTYEEHRHETGLKVEKLAAYVPQQDRHFSLLTVRETLQFALENSVAESDDIKKDSELQKLHQSKVELVLKLLGLEEAADTIAGNDLLRGISGGQKKRLTIGELIISNARLLALDEITNGLDAYVATDLTRSLRQWTRISGGTVVAALQQPTPEMFWQFDDVLLMREGRIVYHGPTGQVIDYISWMGADKPDNMDEADFLVAYLSNPKKYARNKDSDIATDNKATTATAPITPADADAAKLDAIDERKEDDTTATAKSSNGMSSRVGSATSLNSSGNGNGNGNGNGLSNSKRTISRRDLEKWEQEAVFSNGKLDMQSLWGSGLGDKSAASSTEGMVATWQSTSIYQAILYDIEHRKPTDQTKATVSEYSRRQFYRRASHNFMHHLMSNLRRQHKLTVRDPSLVAPRIGQATFLGFLIGGLFYQLPTDPNSNIARIGLILAVLAVNPWANMNELPANDEAKPVLWKQVDAGFYPSLAFTLAHTTFSLPLLAIETIIYSVLTYFLSGFTYDAGRFFFFLWNVFMNDSVFSVIFRFVSFVVPNQFIAQQAGGPSVALALLFAGFLITRREIPNWLIEFYWLSPFAWLARSLAINEFAAPRYDYLTTGGVRAGVAALAYWEMPQEWPFKWSSMGLIWTYYILFVAAITWAVSNVRIETSFGTRRSKPGEISMLEYQKSSIRMDMNAMERATSASAQSVLPFKPVTLTWKNIYYDVPIKGQTEEKRLLTDISGFCEPGECTALMGSSGAGKTTLMDVIAGRKTSGTIKGQILVNGQELDPQTYQKLIGYVEQNDLHMPFSTVAEALEFSAALRLPSSVTAAQRKAFVNELLGLLELEPIRNRIIGGADVSGLSPYQTKLVTIGVELAANPSILFLDEPTSGIDSRAALVVMRVVRKIAATGRTVLCTIHQPSSELFFMFDRLILLRSGGMLVYNSTVGDDGKDIIEYFETAHKRSQDDAKKYVGFKPKHDGIMNPASWMLDILVEARGRKVDYAEIWKDHPLAKVANNRVVELITSPEAAEAIISDKSSRANIITQFRWVLRRQWDSYWRNTSYNLVRAFIQLVCGIVIGLVYLNLAANVRNGGRNQLPAGINSVIGGLLMTFGFAAVLNCATTLPVIAGERPVFYREQASKIYNPYTYAMALCVVEFPFTAFAVLWFVLPYYYLASFQADGILFCKAYLLFYLVALCTNALGHAMTALLPNLVVATQIQGLFFTFIFTFGGVFIRKEGAGALTAGWVWIYWMNWLPKGLNGFALAEYGCDGGVAAGCPSVINNGQEVSISDYLTLQYIGGRTGSSYYAEQVGWLFLTLIIIRMFATLGLRYVNFLKR